MTILEYDAGLYRLLKRCLFGNYVSAAADDLRPSMRRGLLRSIDAAVVGQRCSCGDGDCRSFRVESPATAQPIRCIRFHVDGELSVECDDAGVLQSVEWLPPRPGHRAGRRYSMTATGWAEVPIATV